LTLPRDRGGRLLLGVLLRVLGLWLALSSRMSGRFRSQVTRSVVIELATDDGVSRRFVFDGASRTLALFGGDWAAPADCALRFRSAKLALSVLGSAQAPRLMLDGLAEGTVRFEGNPALFGWFQGLLGAALPSRAARTPLPHPYRAPDRSTPHARLITIEPAEAALDPAWKEAVRAREQLAIWRVANRTLPPSR